MPIAMIGGGPREAGPESELWMDRPLFFDQVPTISLVDPLAQMLGASGSGTVTFGYPEIVRAAGHSCPTVAGAYMMTATALDALYPGEPPVRGSIEVAFRESLEEGTTGVTAAVVGHITGAAGPGGFKGIGGKHARRNLLRFEAAVPLTMRLIRIDTGRAVDADVHPEAIPPDPELARLMRRVRDGEASAEDRREFATLFQERVRALLITAWDRTDVVRVLDAGLVDREC